MSARLAASIACVASAFVATAAHGVSAQRTFVASNGVDINPCTITQPCRSFGAAIGKTLAGGEVIVLDSAGYGVVTIAKSISIIAPAGIYAGVSVPSGQTGITVNGAGIVVVLRGLTVDGVGGSDGIHFSNGARLRIEDCVISSLGAVGIRDDATASEIVIVDSIVRDNGSNGILVSADASAVIEGVRVEHNGSDGISITAMSSLATASIRRSTMVNNAAAGLAAIRPDGSAQIDVVVEDCVLSQNAGDGAFIGGFAATGGVSATLSHSAFGSNGLSGISVFAPGGLEVLVDATDNRFVDNPNAGIKVDGGAVIAWISRNDFSLPLGDVGINIVNGASLVSYKDNTGRNRVNGSTLTGDPF
jgi:hypothetical protein